MKEGTRNILTNICFYVIERLLLFFQPIHEEVKMNTVNPPIPLRFREIDYIKEGETGYYFSPLQRRFRKFVRGRYLGDTAITLLFDDGNGQAICSYVSPFVLSSNDFRYGEGVVQAYGHCHRSLCTVMNTDAAVCILILWIELAVSKNALDLLKNQDTSPFLPDQFLFALHNGVSS